MSQSIFSGLCKEFERYFKYYLQVLGVTTLHSHSLFPFLSSFLNLDFKRNVLIDCCAAAAVYFGWETAPLVHSAFYEEGLRTSVAAVALCTIVMVITFLLVLNKMHSIFS